MRAVRSQNTTPEILVRRITTSLGYRYRLHKAELPGSPDLVFSSRRKVIFVHGCFWHGHECKRGAREPKTNTGYWRAKIQRNRARDKSALASLEAAGWHALVIWECETRELDKLAERIAHFLA